MLQKRFADLYSDDWELQRYGFSWLPVLKQSAESISIFWSFIALRQRLTGIDFSDRNLMSVLRGVIQL